MLDFGTFHFDALLDLLKVCGFSVPWTPRSTHSPNHPIPPSLEAALHSMIRRFMLGVRGDVMLQSAVVDAAGTLPSLSVIAAIRKGLKRGMTRLLNPSNWRTGEVQRKSECRVCK